MRSLGRLTNRVINGVAEKRCSWCFKWFPSNADNFHRKGEGLQSWCKPCSCAYHRPLNRERYERKKAQSIGKLV